MLVFRKVVDIFSICCKFFLTDKKEVRYRVLTVVGMKMIVFWDVAPCSLIEIY
jgi:hypothetical protein